jgi:hypothetical protein
MSIPNEIPIHDAIGNATAHRAKPSVITTTLPHNQLTSFLTTKVPDQFKVLKRIQK